MEPLDQHEAIFPGTQNNEKGSNESRVKELLLEEKKNPSKRNTSTYQHIIYETWVPESCLIFVSLGCVAAIFIILQVHNGKPVPELPSMLILNTIVSILGTASKASLVFVVAAAISQLKWAWYQKSHKLQDFQAFDDASKGPLGAITLLGTRPARSIASIGAIIIILTLTVEPFLQQGVSYPTRVTFRDEPSVTIKQGTEFLVGALDMGFVESLNRGIWSEASQFERNPNCPSGNCTWPQFKSVGWCHKCEDTTEQVVLEGCDFNVTRQDFLDAQNTTIVRECNVTFSDSDSLPSRTPIIISTSDDLNNTDTEISIYVETAWEHVWGSSEGGSFFVVNETFVGVANPIAAFSHVEFLGPEPDNMPQDPITGLIVVKAQQCILDLCAREYSVAVSNGTTEINETSVTHGERFDWVAPGSGDELDGLESGLITGELHCWKGTDTPISDLNLTQVSLPSPYNLTSSEREGLVDRANLAFCTYSPRSLSGPNRQHLYWMWDSNIVEKLVGTTETTFQCEEGGANCGTSVLIDNEFGGAEVSDTSRLIMTIGLEKILENLAASLTKLTLDSSGEAQVAGEVGTLQVFVKVRWEWLILPAALSVGGVVLLVLTMVKTTRRDTPLWKGSILPLVYHNLDAERKEDTEAVRVTQPQQGIVRSDTSGSTARISEMVVEARKTRVRLKRIVRGE